MYNNETGVLSVQTAGTDSFTLSDIDAEEIAFKNITQTPSSAQWGGTTVNYSVIVNTSVSNNVSVFLWNGLSVSGPWTLIGTEVWSNVTAGDQQLNYTRQTTSSDGTISQESANAR